MSDDKELMNEVAGIVDDAAERINKAREEESKQVLKTLVGMTQRDDLVPTGEQVLFYMITQRSIDDVDADKAHRAPQAEGKTVEQLRAEGYTGGSITHPFTFDTYDDAVNNLESKVGAIIADYSQSPKPWGSITCHKEQGTTTYIMVAASCVTLHKVLPTGDTVTNYYDPDTSNTKDIEAVLYKEGKRIVQAQYTFTTAPQVLRRQYPETYGAMVKQALKAMGESNDEQ